MIGSTSTSATKPAIWEDWLFGMPWKQTPVLMPGVLLAAVVTVASIIITDLLNRVLGFGGVISYIMVAIIAGLLVRNTVGVAGVFQPGVGFCLKKLLRLGIIMLGIRLSFFDALRIGAWGVPIVVVAIATGLIVTTYFTRLLKLPDRLGTLIAVGTGICGASAIVATAPGIEARDEEVAYAVANITVFGIAAMFLYPYLSNLLFGGNPIMAGLFQGTSIHETAQVTGAGLIYDQTFNSGVKPSALDVAVVTKLVRNIFMALVIPLMAVVYARRMAALGGSGGKSASIRSLFPLFILGFLALAIIRSFGDGGLSSGGLAFGVWDAAVWKSITSYIANWAGYILATAMAGVGLGTSFQSLRGLGLKPFYVGLLSAAAVGAASVVVVLILGPHVRF